MAKDPAIDRLYRRRARLMTHARDLARSGVHADHTTIMPLLEGMEEFAAIRDRFEWRAIRAQLDRLCAMARDPSRTQLDLAGLRGNRPTARGDSRRPRA